MVMNKVYVVWTAYKVNEYLYEHPNTDKIANFDELITFTELGLTDGNKTYLGVAEYDTKSVKVAKLNSYKQDRIRFNIDWMNANTALALVHSWYPLDIQYFNLDNDGFTIIDSRPEVK